MTTDHGHDVLLIAPLLGKADSCAVKVHHSPKPMRFVWHHVLPQACGGKTEPANLVSLCDSCHYAVHRLMWLIAHGKEPRYASKDRLDLAWRGYYKARQAHTVDKIPDEGGSE